MFYFNLPRTVHSHSPKWVLKSVFRVLKFLVVGGWQREKWDLLSTGPPLECWALRTLIYLCLHLRPRHYLPRVCSSLVMIRHKASHQCRGMQVGGWWLVRRQEAGLNLSGAWGVQPSGNVDWSLTFDTIYLKLYLHFFIVFQYEHWHKNIENSIQFEQI